MQYRYKAMAFSIPTALLNQVRSLNSEIERENPDMGKVGLSIIAEAALLKFMRDPQRKQFIIDIIPLRNARRRWRKK